MRGEGKTLRVGLSKHCRDGPRRSPLKPLLADSQRRNREVSTDDVRPTRSQQPGKSAAAASNFQDAFVLDRAEILEHQAIPRTGFVRMGRRGIEHLLVPMVVDAAQIHEPLLHVRATWPS